MSNNRLTPEQVADLATRLEADTRHARPDLCECIRCLAAYTLRQQQAELAELTTEITREVANSMVKLTKDNCAAIRELDGVKAELADAVGLLKEATRDHLRKGRVPHLADEECLCKACTFLARHNEGEG